MRYLTDGGRVVPISDSAEIVDIDEEDLKTDIDGMYVTPTWAEMETLISDGVAQARTVDELLEEVL